MLRSRAKKKRVMMYLMLLLLKFHILGKLIRIKKLVHNGHIEKKLSMAVNIPFFLTLVIFVSILILKF